jgi:hypothetical protein
MYKIHPFIRMPQMHTDWSRYIYIYIYIYIYTYIHILIIQRNNTHVKLQIIRRKSIKTHVNKCIQQEENVSL